MLPVEDRSMIRVFQPRGLKAQTRHASLPYVVFSYQSPTLFPPLPRALIQWALRRNSVAGQEALMKKRIIVRR